jgi:hypothetical protein
MTIPTLLPPIERLNYFNGQRLEATDLQLEQGYHIRVRRELNRALYTPGIASGLEVLPATNPHAVVVNPGVALDALGREVILLEATEVPVCGLPKTNPAWLYGNFLYIEYAEQTTAVINDACTSSKQQLAWGGPTRIRAVPKLAFADAWPNEAEGPIILAQLELAPNCAVDQIYNQVRKYVDAARPTTRALSYEGDKDIAENNSKKLTFHVIGGPASTVTLYLWATEFSSLYYTQLGAHEHKIPELETSSYAQPTEDLSHGHDMDLAGVTTLEEDPVHAHDLEIPVSEKADENAVKLADNADGITSFSALGNKEFPAKVTPGGHTHFLSGVHPTQTTSLSVAAWSHDHTTKTETADGERVTTGPTGQGDLIDAGTSARLTYLDDLKIWLDEVDITAQVLAQLGGPASGWDKLGDGTSAHPLDVNQGGTGALALERIASMNQGEHILEFKVENDSGGNLRYNLYVA